MRDYSKVSPQFWIGATGKKLRAKGVQSQLVAMYLMTCPHANMLGLYYLPKIYISHECGLTFEGASKGLKGAIEADFCRYDDDSEMVWVPEMAGYQIAATLSANDKRCLGVQNEYNALPANPYLAPFFDKYGTAFCMTKKRGFNGVEISPMQAPSMPLASQEQEHEQEHEQSKNTIKPPAAPRDTEAEQFEIAWLAYPKRPGASKADAFKGWKARIKDGANADEIIDGVRKYAAYVLASNTEPQYIKQGATFFGKGDHWKSDWTIQQARASPASYESAKDKSRREASEKLTGRSQNEQRNQFTDIN